ncbi:MAG: hypothetical protein KDN22_04595 [Verrucomicrobiae bacterium]|nr:hypothetical protein [Verrucomicrobiae bacterium]
MIRNSIVCTLLAFLFSPLLVLAQQPKAKPAEPVELRFLPLGDPPTSEVVVDDKLGSIEKEIDNSLLPPSPLYVVKPPLAGVTKPEYVAVRLSIGVLSLPVETVAKAGQITLYAGSAKDGATTYKQWASVKVPAQSTHGLIVMDKAPGKKTWEKPALRYLQNDTSEFPAGSIRVINSTSLSAVVEINGATQALNGGEMKILPGGGESTRYQVSMGSQKKAVKVANSAVRLSGSARATLVISPEKKAKSKRPARVKVYREE